MAYDRHVTVGLGGTRNRLHAWSPEWLIDPPTVLSFLWVDGFEPFSRMKPPPVFLPPQPGFCRTLLRGLWHWWTMSWRHPMWLRSNILAKCGPHWATFQHYLPGGKHILHPDTDKGEHCISLAVSFSTHGKDFSGDVQRCSDHNFVVLPLVCLGWWSYMVM